MSIRKRLIYSQAVQKGDYIITQEHKTRSCMYIDIRLPRIREVTRREDVYNHEVGLITIRPDEETQGIR